MPFPVLMADYLDGCHGWELDRGPTRTASLSLAAVRFGSLADIEGPYQLSGFCVRCFGAIFRAGSAHIVLLGPVAIAQRTPDLFPDLGCVLQMFSDPCHRRMTKVAVPRSLISNQPHLNGLCLGD